MPEKELEHKETHQTNIALTVEGDKDNGFISRCKFPGKIRTNNQSGPK